MATLEQRVAALEARRKAAHEAHAAPVVADDMSSWLQFVSDDDLLALEGLCERAATPHDALPTFLASDLAALLAIIERTLAVVPQDDDHAKARAALQTLRDQAVARKTTERTDEGS